MASDGLQRSWKQPQYVGHQIIKGRKSDHVNSNQAGVSWGSMQVSGDQLQPGSLGWLPKAPEEGQACPSTPTPCPLGPGFMPTGHSQADLKRRDWVRAPTWATACTGLPSRPEARAPAYLPQAAGKIHPAQHPALRGRWRGPSLALQRC